MQSDAFVPRIKLCYTDVEESHTDDLASTAATRPRARITAEESARRKAAIDYARGSVRLEGFVVSAEVETLNRRYIDGEITSVEHSDAIRRNSNL